MLTKLINKIVGVGQTKMVLIVRTDLKMSQGKIAAHCAHAAVTLYNNTKDIALLKEWIRWGQPKVVLKISNNCESKMQKIYDTAKTNGLNTCLIHDAGRTQIESGTLTVLGIGPNLIKDIDKLTCNLKLL